MQKFSQLSIGHHCEQMSQRKPLVRFDTQSRAHLVSESVSSSLSPPHTNSMPRRRRGSKKRSGGKVRSTKGRPRIVKGRVNVRVAGYSGVQKVAPSKLIPFLPTNKVRLAAKKALVASGVKPSRGGQSARTKRRRRRGGRKVRRTGKKSNRRRRRRRKGTKTRTRRKRQ